MLGASGGGLKTLSVEFCSSLLQSPHLLNTRLFLASDAWCVRRSVCRVLELLMRPLGQLKEGIRVSAAFSRVHSPEVCTGLGNRP